MRGSLKEVPFSDVLQLMVMGKKTGRLSVTNGEDFLELYFKGGIIIFGKMINKPEEIGETLITRGIIDEKIFEEAKKKLEKGVPNIGMALIEMGINDEDIKRAYEDQIKKYVSEALLWDEGYFNFEPDEFPNEKPLVSIDPSYLMLESARIFDEWKKIQQIVPSLDQVCILKDKNYKPKNEIEESIINKIDGRKTVRQILEGSGNDLFKSAEVMRELIFKEIIDTKEKEEKDEITKEKILEHLNLGYAFLKTGLFEEAEREFKRLYELSSDMAEGPFYLGLLNIYKKNFDEALKYFYEAKEKDPNNEKILTNLLYIYIEMEDFENAKKIIDILDSRKFDDERYLLNKAIYFEKTGKKEEFEKIVRTLLRGKSFLKTPYFLLAKKLFKERKFLQVIEILSILKGYDKNNAEVNYGLGISYLAINRFKEAEEFLREAIRLAPSNLKYKMSLADFLYERGRYNESKNVYMQVLSLDSKNEKALFRLGNIFFKEGKYKEALKYYEEILKLNPENKRVKRNIEIIKKTLNV